MQVGINPRRAAVLVGATIVGWGFLVPIGLAAGSSDKAVGAAASGDRPVRTGKALTGKSAANKNGSDVLLVPEDDPWTAALAAPVAARLQPAGRVPLLLAISSPPTHEADWIFSLAPPRHVTLFATTRPMKLSSLMAKKTLETVAVGSGPVEASLALAKKYWTQSREVIVAAADDSEAIILGASLAAARGLPLLIRERAASAASVAFALRELGAEQILVAASNPQQPPAWAASRKFKAEVLGPQTLEHRLIAALGPASVHNLIVARVPEGSTGRSAWLAPYMSVARSAGVVLSHSLSAAVAEADVAQLVEREGLRVRTVTILADYAAIGSNVVEIEGDDAAGANAPAPAAKIHYTVRTEPCIPRDGQKLASYGVGRIPLESLGDASVLFVRGLLREKLFAAKAPRLLMVANSGIIRRPLPLCETISRVTAEEFKNFGIHIDEFYGKLADSPEVLAAAKSANVIIYEGHLAYQDLINVPTPHRVTTPDTYFDEELSDLEGDDVPRDPAAPAVTTAPLRPAPPLARAALHAAAVAPIGQTGKLAGPLMGLPIVVLQSCDSLEEPILWKIDELGGVAVIGSVTPIHSGSGSALVQAAVAAVLYRGGTLGEALRDAQNYMFCLEDLKSRRGHKEQAKGRRVALSFRLWGDPELRVLPMPIGAPQDAPVMATWSAPNTLTIKVPEKRLADARSDKYVASMFPNSQAASMVRTHEGDPLRRLVPVYYFRVPLPENLSAAQNVVLEASGSESRRASVRIDPVEKLVYVVYFPEPEKAGESIVLRLQTPRPAEQIGRAAQ